MSTCIRQFADLQKDLLKINERNSVIAKNTKYKTVFTETNSLAGISTVYF